MRFSTKLKLTLGAFISIKYCSYFYAYRHLSWFSRTPRLEQVKMEVTRVGPVEGSPGKGNEVLFHPALEGPCRSSLVYFGGDVQNYEEEMAKHRDNKRHVRWSLERTCALLTLRFPNHCVFVVKPSAMALSTFSAYPNFVKSNSMGAPEHGTSTEGLKHLNLLLERLALKLHNKAMFDSIKLIGFSKGCVVLNQLLYEFHALEGNPEEAQLEKRMKSVTDMYWLDGGHPGGSNTWVTDADVLKSFVKLGVKVHIHVTPFQVYCSRRPWIGKEEKAFGDTLRRLGVDVYRKLHFQSVSGSLEYHFKVLEEFTPIKSASVNSE